MVECTLTTQCQYSDLMDVLISYDMSTYIRIEIVANANSKNFGAVLLKIFHIIDEPEEIIDL